MDEFDDEYFKVGNYVLIKKIGSGSFSTVYLAESSINNSLVAIKVISKISIESPSTFTRFTREINLLKNIDHPFISHFFELFEDNFNYYLVLEYAENGNMEDFLKDRGPLAEIQARHFFYELISVLDYLHDEMHIAHRDIKAENILLDRFNNIRVIDFGLSNIFSDIEPSLTTACGSPAYAAPEMIKGEPYTKAADIWSAGVLLYFMVVGKLPFESNNVQDLLNSIVTSKITYPSNLPSKLVNLLQIMLEKSTEKRASIKQIKEHPWIKDSGYGKAVDSTIIRIRKQSSIINPYCIYELEKLGYNFEGFKPDSLKEERTSQISLYLQMLRDRMVFELSLKMMEAKNEAFQNSTKTEPVIKHSNVFGSLPKANSRGEKLWSQCNKFKEINLNNSKPNLPLPEILHQNLYNKKFLNFFKK